MEHNWVACSNGGVTPLAIVGGHDSDGDTIYIGRAYHCNDLLPAKVIPSKGKAYVAYGGQEVELDNYEVLSGLHYDWVADSNGSVPSAAVKVGRNVDGEDLYAGRGYHSGALILGKVHPSHGCLYVPHGAEEVQLTEYEVLTQPDKWVDATPSSIPEGALVGGHDSDGDTIYVGRVMLHGDMLPTKIIPSKGGAYVCYGQEEHELDNFQVLVGAGFKWQPANNGDVPHGAVPAGRNVDGETLYIGRANYCDSLTVGKLHPSHGCLYLPFGGEEHKLDSYEVLVRY